ncbi:hypothetical protein ZIOFF_072677 [Zingiber officinale]|uniref:Uncharacterized protein n=1 Tax=Zingiber officinale TaxID=94328 RepID=A0A8J5CS32_ZINOF|nr:hypothetical protein ZIOFF_072677 [Zingiber officinale]
MMTPIFMRRGMERIGERGEESSASSGSQPGPLKRLKTLEKGKAKVEMKPWGVGEDYAAFSEKAEEEEEEEEEQTCGICFSGSGRSVRGRIDCCDHYFCFVCIMEWAKIESRCPLCKRRFGSIRRPPVRGVFLAERVVDAPVRDQVYNHGNESRAPDPYANITCSICHGSQDEELLLLCDLCDSASNTFCIGLGATIPEGDWYCADCTISKDWHSGLQLEDDPCPQYSPKLGLSKQFISIADVVADEIPSYPSRRFNVGVQEPQTTYQSRNVFHGRRDNSGTQTDSSSVPTIGESLNNPAIQNEAVARTLQSSRNLHGHIQSLRKNWNNLRTGSLQFSNLSAVRITEKRQFEPLETMNTSKQEGNSYHANQEQTNTSSVYNSTCKIADSEDISKAWKMMEMAKAVQSNGRENKSNNLLNSLCKKNDIKNAVNHHSLANYSSMRNASKGAEKCQSGLRTCNGESPLGNSASQSGAEEKFQGPHWKNELSPQVALSQTSVLPNSQNSLTHSGSAAFSSDIEAKNKEISRNKMDTSLNLSTDSNRVKRTPNQKFESFDKLNLGGPSIDALKTSDSTYSSCKSEIQYLVKLNLRLLTRDKKLGTLRNMFSTEIASFKQVARIATHTILAACGLEHSELCARAFSTPICKHSKENQFRKSNLMSNSCHECFCSFVQSVVKSVTSETNLFQSPPC